MQAISELKISDEQTSQISVIPIVYYLYRNADSRITRHCKIMYQKWLSVISQIICRYLDYAKWPRQYRPSTNSRSVGASPKLTHIHAFFNYTLTKIIKNLQPPIVYPSLVLQHFLGPRKYFHSRNTLMSHFHVFRPDSKVWLQVAMQPLTSSLFI